jgi:cephalosporin-C deacetylase-like acetyl esterase
MIHKRILLTLACTLSAVAFAQAEIPIDNNQPPTPSATKDRFAPPFTGGKPGDLLSQKEIGTEIKGARAWKVRYVSKDVNDVPTEVTGLVIAPEEKGKDRKVMTWCHGTTGLGDAATPSAQPNPARNLITYFDANSTQQIDFGVPGLQGWIDDGYVVCATDYQGLGTPGQHQYVVNRTQARDAVYLVHAARKMEEVGAGTKFGGAGWSQGGGASAAVAELDPADYGDLKLVGTVCMSPGAAIVAYETPVGPTAAMGNHNMAPDSHLVMMLAGFQVANPDKLKLSDYFTPLGIEILETAWNIQPVHHLNDSFARLFRLKGPVMQEKPTNLDAWKEAITAGSAGTRKPVAPVLMCMDTFDGGTAVPVIWQTKYADLVKKNGGTIEIKEYPNDDHFSLPNSCAPDALKWLNGLF